MVLVFKRSLLGSLLRRLNIIIVHWRSLFRFNSVDVLNQRGQLFFYDSWSKFLNFISVWCLSEHFISIIFFIRRKTGIFSMELRNYKHFRENKMVWFLQCLKLKIDFFLFSEWIFLFYFFTLFFGTQLFWHIYNFTIWLN